MIMENTTITTKVCSRCKRELPLSEFHKNKHSKLGIQCECKECRSEIDKAYKLRLKLQKQGVIEQNTTPIVEKLHKVYAHPSLASFQPRQLMEELKARGYRWDYMLEPQRKIYFEKI